MPLYELKQEDVNDVLTLISAATLTITANYAQRVAQLQGKLASLKPSTALDECKAQCEEKEQQVRECLRARDVALLEAGLSKSREAKQLDSIAMLELCARGECDPSTCASMRHNL